MLIKDLYTIKSFEVEDLQIKATVFINKDNEIFKGHFPNNPVMPGVCTIQIIKELSEKALNCKLFMQKATNIKFMALIVPDKNPLLNFDIAITEDDTIFKIRNTTSFDSTVALKFSGEFKKTEKHLKND